VKFFSPVGIMKLVLLQGNHFCISKWCGKYYLSESHEGVSMKKLITFLLVIGSFSTFAQENIIYGKECTIDTYDSTAESRDVGGFDGDTFHGAYQPLVDKLLLSNFDVRENDYNRSIHYFKDTEFLVELKMNTGRSSNRNISLRIINTGRFGIYSDVYFIETSNSGDAVADAKKLIATIPKCVVNK
jgi:hypothetical protein